MIEIGGFQKNRVFTLATAKDLLPLIYRLTDEASRETKYLMGCIEALPDKKGARATEIQEQINVVIEKWQNKIERLGGKPKGLWLADFDNGQGYYCWKFPETEILYHHGYQDGFTGRILLGNNRNDHENSHSPN